MTSRFMALLDPNLAAPEGRADPPRKPRYKLATALDHLEQLVTRAQIESTEPDRPWLVTELLLFGSVHRARPMVGDLDVFVKGALRPGWNTFRADDWCADRGEGVLRGWGMISWYEALMRRLKSSSPVIQLCANDPREHGWPYVVVPLDLPR